MGSKGVALVTGASSGIGEEFARRLAKDGYDLILVARRQQKLEALANQLENNNKIKAEVQVIDLASPVELEKLEKRVSEVPDLTLLVNNAGFATMGNFADMTPSSQKGMVHTHIMATVGLTRAALPGMIARRRGGVINVASVAAYAPYPGNIVYSATKLFLINFTRGLRVELEGTGVKAEALCPGFTRSGIHDSEELKAFRKLPDFLWLDAGKVVDEALQRLGGNRTVVTVGLKYQLLAAVSNSPLTPFSLWMMTRMKKK
ncbi:SDR family oxidoreductase [Candidatus Chlorohelix sp.]|uniref:SDR family NAD(P)-dependent oxidoreductase n=1 Tax=Candidatus Chlorohelix sp. TaxID=3139201 RepID=UPI0030403585